MHAADEHRGLQSLVTWQACVDSEPLPTSVKVCYPANAAGQTATVTVSYNYNWLPIRLLGGVHFSSAVTASATMRLESPIPTGSWVPASSC